MTDSWLSACRVAVVSAAGVAATSVGYAECNCRGGGGAVHTAPSYADHYGYGGQYGGGMTSPMLPPSMQMLGPVHGGVPGPDAIAAATPGANRFGVAPPPGTLGHTFQRRTTLVEDDKHPRAGIIDVYLPEDVDVTARGMKAKWNGKHWRLETIDPLLPGVPTIYAIKAERKTPTGDVLSTDVRWVRLIMGRIVELQF